MSELLALSKEEKVWLFLTSSQTVIDLVRKERFSKIINIFTYNKKCQYIKLGAKSFYTSNKNSSKNNGFFLNKRYKQDRGGSQQFELEGKPLWLHKLKKKNSVWV